MPVGAPAGHGHGLSVAVRVRVRAGHAVVLSQRAGGAVGVLRGARGAGVGGRRRVQLVGKGSVVELRRWWGLVVGLFVGLCVRHSMAGGRECRGHVHAPPESEGACVEVSREGTSSEGCEAARGYAGESRGQNLE